MNRNSDLLQEVRALRKCIELRADAVLLGLEKLVAATENAERTENSFVGLVTKCLGEQLKKDE